MKKKYAGDFQGSKVYFTEADPSAQSFYCLGPQDFDVKIKLWLLIADYTILSTGHMLQSPLTYAWLTENARDIGELAGENAILPSLREDREGFRDFVVKEPEEEDQPTLLKDQRDLLTKRAERLSDIFQTAITWSPMAESYRFRDAMVKDLAERDSPLRKRLVGVSKTAIEQLSKDIESCEFLNREMLMHLVRKHCPAREKSLLRYGDIFYYLSGAFFKDAFPVFHPEAAALCREKISHAACSIAHTTNEKADIWHEIVDTWGLTYTALQKLPLSEIASIRHDPAGIDVRRTWATLIKQARDSQIKEQNIVAFLKARDKLIELFKQEMRVQRQRYAFGQKVRGRVEVGCWVTGGLATVLGFFMTGGSLFAVGAGIGTGVLGLLTGKPILDRIEKKLAKAELVILATNIQHRSIKDL